MRCIMTDALESQFKELIYNICSKQYEEDNKDHIIAFLNTSTSSSLFVVGTENVCHIIGHGLDLPESDEVEFLVIICKGVGKVRSVKDLVTMKVPLLQTDSKINALELIRQMVEGGIGQLFAYMSQDDSSTVINKTKGKFQELSLSLQNAQQTILAPDLQSTSHSRIKEMSRRGNCEEILDNDTTLMDSKFLNELTSCVNDWIRKIKAFTNLGHEPSDGRSISDEIFFWSSYKNALRTLEQQMNSGEVRLTLEILSNAKRLHAALAFKNVGIEDALETANINYSLLDGFPIDELLSVPLNCTIEELISAFDALFGHFKRLRSFIKFPIQRAIQLVNVVIIDLVDKLCAIFSQFNIMSLSATDFENTYNNFMKLAFKSIQENLDSTVLLFRELLRKRQEKFFSIKLEISPLEELKGKVSLSRSIRMENDNLLLLLSSFSNDPKAENELMYAYDNLIIPWNIFEFELHSFKERPSSVNLYFRKCEDLKKMVISELNMLFIPCECLADYLSIFNKIEMSYKSHGDLYELMNDTHKLKILMLVNKDFDQLAAQYNQRSKDILSAVNHYVLSSPSAIIAEVTMRIYFSNKTKWYQACLQKLLGPDWNNYSTGQDIMKNITNFVNRINVTELVRSWIDGMSHVNIDIHSKVLKIVSNDAVGMKTSFDVEICDVAQTLCRLKSIGLDVPLNLILKFRDIPALKNICNIIDDTIYSCTLVIEELFSSDFGKKFGFLLNPQLTELALSYRALAKYTWEDILRDLSFSDIESENKIEIEEINVSEVSHVIISIHSKVNRLMSDSNQLSKAYNQIYKKSIIECQTESGNFNQLELEIKKIQGILSNLSLQFTDNIKSLYDVVNSDLRDLVLDIFLRELNSFEVSFTGDTVPSVDKISSFVHHLEFRDDNLILVPEISVSKSSLYEELNLLLGCLNRFQPLNYGSIINKFDFNGSNIFALDLGISRAASKIEECVQDSDVYMRKWISLQEIWDLDATNETEFSRHFDDSKLSNWLSFFTRFMSLKSLFDTENNHVSFKNRILIDYSKVRNRATLKFDSFRRSFINRFASKLRSEVQDQHLILADAIKKLQPKLELNLPFKELVIHLKFFIDLTKSFNIWKTECDIISKSQLALKRQKYRFPEDWIYSEQVSNDFEVVAHLKAVKDNKIEENKNLFSKRFNHEVSLLNNQIFMWTKKWNEEKPGLKSLDSKESLDELLSLSKALEYFMECKENINFIISALNFEVDEIMLPESFSKDIYDLKLLWTFINDLSNKLSSFRKLLWNQVDILTLRKQLEDVSAEMRKSPIHIKSYDAFVKQQELANEYIDALPIIGDLKSSKLLGRHWNLIANTLEIENISLELLSLGDLWDHDLVSHSASLRKIVVQANNEFLIEERMNQIRSRWAEEKLVSFDYSVSDRKFTLVKNWESLIEMLISNIEELSTMKNSPFFNVFETILLELEVSLNQILIIFELASDLQRQWIYLEGVFNSNTSDIKNILPNEYSRFNSCSYDLLNILKKMIVSPIFDILKFPNLQNDLIFMKESLNSTKSALKTYLENQRELYPRFYFLGNEDLLEIVGESNNIMIINRHISKMFTGIARLLFKDTGLVISGFVSKEGEIVTLRKEVSLEEYPKLHEWFKLFEQEIKETLATLLPDALFAYNETISSNQVEGAIMMEWFDRYPVQILILALQVSFTSSLEKYFNPDDFSNQSNVIDSIIKLIAEYTVGEMEKVKRIKVQNVLIELVHHRDIYLTLSGCSTSAMVQSIVGKQQLYHFDSKCAELTKSLRVSQGLFSCEYGFEYLGSSNKLVYTSLTDRLFFSMTQALNQKYGGSPFGPAGTGKTESIKALGHNLGKMVLVFCCDESFDYDAMSRILLGICKVGCWCCLDEFNRLNQKDLSAISSQIEQIERCLGQEENIMLGNQIVELNPSTGIFVTMNPGYIGRSEFPENLKKLFRSFSMSTPDVLTIVEVLLYTQSFSFCHDLAKLVIGVFEQFKLNFSDQTHYDLGLRAIKNVISRCGQILRKQNRKLNEASCLRQSIDEMISPMLIRTDAKIYSSIMDKTFADRILDAVDLEFSKSICQVANEKCLTAGDDWLNKATQLFNVQNSRHGIILVGKAGSGKTTLWKSVISALANISKHEKLTYVMDCKILSKDQLFGRLNPLTKEWKDGILTNILREISDRKKETERLVWIIFDGDIDPEWAENLNSVLDDNRVLTLPNCERIFVPPNVRFIFEVTHLRFSTPATVSRCGVVWIDDDVVSIKSIQQFFLSSLDSFLRNITFDSSRSEGDDLAIKKISGFYESTFSRIDIEYLVKCATERDHVMEFNSTRLFHSCFIFLKSYIRRLSKFHGSLSAVPANFLPEYCLKSAFMSLMLGFVGDCTHSEREMFVRSLAELEVFASLAVDCSTGFSSLDYEVSQSDFSWIKWSDHVPHIELSPEYMTNSNLVVPTSDTLRNESSIYSIINEGSPLLLCGPPGSGKTMSLLEALRKSPELEVVSLNFSRETSPMMLLKSLYQYCKLEKRSKSLFLLPKSNKKLVLFCDEVNLPAEDKYGTQHVVSLMRELIEQSGFWDPSQGSWVSMSGIQIVAACNPPDYPGRVKLSSRFLRHVIILFIDYPQRASLLQIYGALNSALLKHSPELRIYSNALTKSMITVYERTKSHLSTNIQLHYIYSPRELSRWVKGIYSMISNSDFIEYSDLVYIWLHEGLRLFYDRLVGDEEKAWTTELFRDVAIENFKGVDVNLIFQSEVFHTNILSRSYKRVDKKALKSFIASRLTTFCDEELNKNFILYDDMLHNVLSVNEVLNQPTAHMVLIGPSSSGKTSLVKFVSWMNGIRFIQLKVSPHFNMFEFEEILRNILLKCLEGEEVCFLIDESCILESSFVERINNLLANSEVPGLFEGDQHENLIKKCSEKMRYQGITIPTEEEIYSWFCKFVSEKLHIFFNLNSLDNDSKISALSSPALFNRCIINWIGNWSSSTYMSICHSYLDFVPLDIIPAGPSSNVEVTLQSVRDKVSDILLKIHVYGSDSESLTSFVSPGRFVNFVKHFIEIFKMKSEKLEEDQRRTTLSLDCLRETMIKVNDLQNSLTVKQEELNSKDLEAKLMLNKMITDQNEAERKREFSIETQRELEKQEAQILKRTEEVQRDLELAEPRVLEAQRGVQNIKKQHLTEIRSMTNPPAAVKMTMESVCILLGSVSVKTWRDVQSVVRKDDFISRIVNFDIDSQLTLETKEVMYRNYFSRAEYNFDAVNRASKACGPLLQWVKAQITYSDVLHKVGPLRKEVDELEVEAKNKKSQLIAIDEMINELETSIETYKDEYSFLIREAEKIKSEMHSVERKVSRSLKLINDLSNETDRWKKSISRFSSQRGNVLGSSIISSAFLVYAGGLDQSKRNKLVQHVQSLLKDSSIDYEKDLSIASYLMTEDEILKLQSVELLKDQLYLENYLIIKRCLNPLIIDPSGNVLDEFINNGLLDSVKVTSFLDKDFSKHLENTVRFGGTLVIRNFEFYNAYLSPLIRGDIYYNGGRTVVDLGKNSIDVSPHFNLILHTKESAFNIPPEVNSRVSFVNFTPTIGSLENMILDTTLRKLYPEVAEKRDSILKLQGEYKLKLATLEDNLLSSLTDAEGHLLEDDSILSTLELIKHEASNIDDKMNNSRGSIEQVEKIRAKYQPVAVHSVLIFQLFSRLKRFNILYQFPVVLFLDIFERFISCHGEVAMDQCIAEFYQVAYSRISCSLVFEHKIAVAVALNVIFYAEVEGNKFKELVLSLMRSMRTREVDILQISSLLGMNLSDPGIRRENIITDENKFVQLTKKLVSEVLKLDESFSLTSLMVHFSSNLLGDISKLFQSYKLEDFIADKHASMSKSLIIATKNNFDATYMIQELGINSDCEVMVVSMGSKESVREIEKILQLASRRKVWLVVQNIQMAPEWINLFPSVLSKTILYEGSKVILGCSTSSAIPTTLLSISNTYIIEEQLSFKDSLQTSMKTVMGSNHNNLRALFKHMCFLLAWYHVIVVERTKYAPASFFKKYDVNNTDLNTATHELYGIFAVLETKHTVVSAEVIPWKLLQYVIGDITYGSKTEKPSDLEYLKTLASKVFNLKSFNKDYNLIENDAASALKLTLHPPEISVKVDYFDWAKALPNSIPIQWLGLTESDLQLYNLNKGVDIITDAENLIIL